MNEQHWYTLKEIEALTGRPEKTLRRHNVQEWELDGMARKENGKWLCNQDALTDIRELVNMREKRENERLMKQEAAANAANAASAVKVEKPAAAHPGATEKPASKKHPISGFYFEIPNAEAEKLSAKFVEGFRKGMQPTVDAIGRQTIYVDPEAKSVRIVLPTGCTASLLFDIEKPAVENLEKTGQGKSPGYDA